MTRSQLRQLIKNCCEQLWSCVGILTWLSMLVCGAFLWSVTTALLHLSIRLHWLTGKTSPMLKRAQTFFTG